MRLIEEAQPRTLGATRGLIGLMVALLAVVTTAGLAVYQVEPSSTWALSPTMLLGTAIFGSGCGLLSGPAWLRVWSLALIAVGLFIALTHANL